MIREKAQPLNLLASARLLGLYHIYHIYMYIYMSAPLYSRYSDKISPLIKSLSSPSSVNSLSGFKYSSADPAGIVNIRILWVLFHFHNTVNCFTSTIHTVNCFTSRYGELFRFTILWIVSLHDALHCSTYRKLRIASPSGFATASLSSFYNQIYVILRQG